MSMAGIEQKNSEQKSLPRTPIGLEAQIWQYAPDLAILSDSSFRRNPREALAILSPTSSEIAAEDLDTNGLPRQLRRKSQCDGKDTVTLQFQAEEAFGARRFGDAVTLLAVAVGREPESAELADGLAFAEQVRGSI